MIRKKKKYVRPRQIFEAERIKEEDKLVTEYGLKNKTEVWKTSSKVTYYRNRARELAKKTMEEQEVFFGKLRALGLKIEGTADVLSLKAEDLLKRRLPTVVASKKLAHTVKQARQMVVHQRVIVNGSKISSPSYLVPISEENKIEIKKNIKKNKAKAAVEEKPVEAPFPEQPTSETPVEEVKAEESKPETKE